MREQADFSFCMLYIVTYSYMLLIVCSGHRNTFQIYTFGIHKLYCQWFLLTFYVSIPSEKEWSFISIWLVLLRMLCSKRAEAALRLVWVFKDFCPFLLVSFGFRCPQYMDRSQWDPRICFLCTDLSVLKIIRNPCGQFIFNYRYFLFHIWPLKGSFFDTF